MNPSDLPSDAIAFLVWLAFKGAVTREDIAQRWQEDETLPDLLVALLSAGLIGEADDCIYMEDDGDAFLSTACREAVTDAERVAVGDFLVRFEAIDGSVKQAVTRWQGCQAHTAALGKEALGAVDDWMSAHAALHDTVGSSEPVVGKLLEEHLRGLDEAVGRFLAGDTKAFSGGDDSSYHSRWFVMHELILRSVGKSR